MVPANSQHPGQALTCVACSASSSHTDVAQLWASTWLDNSAACVLSCLSHMLLLVCRCWWSSTVWSRASR